MASNIFWQAKIPCYLCVAEGGEGTGCHKCQTCHKKICEAHCAKIGYGYGKKDDVFCPDCFPYKSQECCVCHELEDDYFPFVKCHRCGKMMCKGCQHQHNRDMHHNLQVNM